MHRKYRGLRTIGLLLKIIGVFELFVGLFCAFVLPLALSDSHISLFQSGIRDYYPAFGLMIGIITGVLIFLAGLVCGLLTFSLGELINVVLAIEENTRTTALKRQEQQ
ncbi:MAG: hypothetical protein Q7U31_02925 [Anaerolineaceae bacterium]|nr:hypothetical protein [Anaerolineaceae bacterium]